jgi:hypothetical protein
MKILDVEQGSTEWMLARLSLPTASGYGKILTEKTFKPSASRDLYCAELVAEYILGQPIEWGGNAWTGHGHELEPEARKWYAFNQDVEVERVGFILRDDGETGASPDGLVKGKKKGLEIKCFSAPNHMLRLLDFHLKAPDFPFAQVQGNLYVSDYDEWDVLYYCPGLPNHIVTAEPNEKWRKEFVPVLDDFIERVNKEKARFEHVRNLHPEHPEIKTALKAQEQAALAASDASRLQGGSLAV